LRGRALTQRDPALLRPRLTEQESLAVVAAHTDQGEGFGHLLDADAHGDAAETVREVDDSLARRCIHFVAVAVGDKDAGELEFGERQLLCPRQRGMAAAEIVDREMDVERPLLFCDLARQGEFRDDLPSSTRTPCCRCRARAKASTPTICFFAQIDLRLIPEFDPVVPQRLVEIDAGGRGRRVPKPQLIEDLQYGAGLERLLERSQHPQLLFFTDAFDVVEHGRY
jgi:hypothetical protein